MDLVKAVRQRFGCTVNDALMAGWTGALRRYGAEVRGDARLQEGGGKLEFKAMLMLGLPREVDENNMTSSLCNNMLFTSCPLPIDEDSAVGRLTKTVQACKNLKSKAYMAGLKGFTNFITSVAPNGLLRKAASETFCKHSMLISNVPGTTGPMVFPKHGGEEVKEIQMVFPNVISQLSIITYNGYVNANLVVDPELFPNATVLSDFWIQELQTLANTTDAAGQCDG
jgi:hypothetical protein